MKLTSVIFILLLLSQNIFAQKSSVTSNECHQLQTTLEEVIDVQKYLINRIESKKRSIKNLSLELSKELSSLNTDILKCKQDKIGCRTTNRKIENYNNDLIYLQDLQIDLESIIDNYNTNIEKYGPHEQRYIDNCNTHDL